MRLRIVSGGQTGVDRAALDVALRLGLPVGGWCPAGRVAEDGPLPLRYPLRETPTPDPAERTLWNVRDSDGTLVVEAGALSTGTRWTLDCARRLERPVYRQATGSPPAADAFLGWLQAYGVTVLNVAGPRESESAGIYLRASVVLEALLGSAAAGSSLDGPT